MTILLSLVVLTDCSSGDVDLTFHIWDRLLFIHFHTLLSGARGNPLRYGGFLNRTFLYLLSTTLGEVPERILCIRFQFEIESISSFTGFTNGIVRGGHHLADPLAKLLLSH